MVIVAATVVIVDGSAITTLGAQRGGTSTFVAGVADAETGQPLEGAEDILLGVHRLARANALGDASIDGVPRVGRAARQGSRS
jgi:hypothetical protein